MEIRLLPEETISRIAAGEVIERPLNVVKELVENSIDAGSSAITVEIRDGGITMIRVTDNGCGIERDQITKAFIRHATSKITDAEDLSRLASLGFRGEALASIAAVAQVEMITKVRGAVSGTRAVNDHLAAYSPDAPVQIDLSEIGAPDGTTVIVRNLFGAIPVRRRFLRQPQTEAGYITDLIEKQALSHPAISFHYRVNGQDKLHTTGNGNLKELIYRIYGRETAGAIVPIHAEDSETGMKLEGFLGRPEISRSSRSFETFFINGRMLRSKELSAGLEEGYRTDLMQHRFPFAVLHLTMPPEDVDVNVHPSKMEVRFTDRRAVFRFLDRSVHETLHQIELIPRASVLTAKEAREQKRREDQLKADQLKKAPRYEPFEKTDSRPAPGAPAVSFARPADPSPTPGATALSSARPEDPSPAPGAPALSSARPADPSSAPGASARSAADLTAVPSGQSLSRGEPDGFVFEDKRPRYHAAGEGTVHAFPSQPSAAPISENAETAKKTSGTPAGEPAPVFSTEEATDQQLRKEIPIEAPLPADGPSGPASLPLPAGKPEQLTLASLDPAIDGDPTSTHLLTREKADRYKYIGQIFDTYWIIEYEKRILIIDQHAAHEKVNYERMMRRIAHDHPDLAEERTVRDAAPEEYLALDRLLQHDDVLHPANTGNLGTDSIQDKAGDGSVYVASQQLMPPIIIRLSGREETAYRDFREVFSAMGYEIEEFGGGSYAIRAVPTELFGESPDGLLRETLEEIMNERISGTPRAVISKVASMSCKAAVKGNRRLNEAGARALIEELLSLDNPYHCPHGRPTMIVMTQQEMDRKFKRII